MEDVRRQVLDAITGNIPRIFWAEAEQRADWVYKESYEDTINDSRVRPSQARFRIPDDRHWFMEQALCENTETHGGVAALGEVKINSWYYTLVHFGFVTLTQKYVHSAGDLAAPAKFRKHLAATNSFSRQGDLFSPSGPPSPSTQLSALNGILIHGPLSRDFRREEFRQLGFIRFAVPYSDYSGWAVNMSMAEIMASYLATEERRTDPAPVWKPIRKMDDQAS